MAKTNNYKQIIVPAGTRLFRVSNSIKTFSFMRFGYCSRAAHMTSLSKIFYPIQIWIVKKEIYSALFISRVLESGLVYIIIQFNKQLSNELFDYFGLNPATHSGVTPASDSGTTPASDSGANPAT